MHWFALLALTLLLTRLGLQIWLEILNRRHVLAHRNEIPAAVREVVDEPTYRKSFEYTLAKGTLRQWVLVWDTAILALVLFSGILPQAYAFALKTFGDSVWALAGFIFVVSLVLPLTGLPFSWYAQFRLEERFGFNTTTQSTWWIDRAKGLVLAILLAYPLLVLLLKFVEWSADAWWFFAWAALVCFHLVLAVLAPVLILPLFNKFTPLPEGPLRERLLALASATRFEARSIQVMDGSRRSRHSNAFFTGFGSLRKIVLFDTLLQQLKDPELEAVLAHEIGHFKKKHIPKMLAFSTLSSLAGFYALSLLSRQEWFYRAFGFPPGEIVPALLLFGLLAGLVTFWVSPALNRWSRRYEYQADAFARDVIGAPGPLIHALRKLNEKNLSNLTPHPWYSGFYYSHPTLIERERALLT